MFREKFSVLLASPLFCRSDFQLQIFFKENLVIYLYSFSISRISTIEV